MGGVRVVPVGERACLVEVEDALEAASLAAWARTVVDADEVVPAAATVLFDGCVPAEVEAVLVHRPADGAALAGPLVRVPMTYDGPDLELVAGHWGCSVEEVVSLHVSTEFTALFGGFAPGFSYLSGLPVRCAVPRLASPRTRVPAGSVGLADRWCGAYPTASPGGWLLLGTTDAPLWDVTREQPALLAPGTRVRFEVAG